MQQEQHKQWNSKRFNNAGKRYEFTFVGEKVGTICFGGDLTIGLSDDFYTRINFSLPFIFTHYGQSQLLRPSEATLLAPLLTLIGSEVIKAVADAQSALIIEFENGAIIEAPSLRDGYGERAWFIHDKHGFQVEGNLREDVVVWPPVAESFKKNQ